MAALIWRRRGVIFGWQIGVGVLCFACSAWATGNVVVTWQPSISTNVVGYDICYGVKSGVYTTTNYVTGLTNITITGLVAGTTYYFAATSVDNLGNQSPFSGETSYILPTNFAPPTAATLEAAASPASGRFVLSVNGLRGASYVVQVSTDLVIWTPVLTNIAPFTLVDSNVHHFHQRFFRAHTQPRFLVPAKSFLETQ